MNTKIEKLATELLEAIKEEKKNQKIERGAVVEVAGHEWIVLKVEDGKVHCVLKELLESRRFDEDENDFSSSDLRNWLNDDFFDGIASLVDASKLHIITTDLLSLDGQTEYGSCVDKVSLLTVDMYRENRDILPNEDKWWWLATPFSTKCNDFDTSVCCVSPSGCVNSLSCCNVIAVRPFCIFDSSIFES